MKITKVYEVTIPTSEVKSTSLGYYLDKDLGLALSQGKGYYHSNGSAKEKDAVKIGNTWYLLSGTISVNESNDIDAAIRKEALSKLSNIEKAALGLKY